MWLPAASQVPQASPGQWGRMGPALVTTQRSRVSRRVLGGRHRDQSPPGWKHGAAGRPRELAAPRLSWGREGPGTENESSEAFGGTASCWLPPLPSVLSPSLFPREDNLILVQVCLPLRNNLSKQAHPKQSQEEQPGASTDI